MATRNNAGTDGASGVNAESPQDDTTGPHDTLGGPTPKRRRVTRACDECRRKKIKCDGKQVFLLHAFRFNYSHVHIVQHIHIVCSELFQD